MIVGDQVSILFCLADIHTVQVTVVNTLRSIQYPPLIFVKGTEPPQDLVGIGKVRTQLLATRGDNINMYEQGTVKSHLPMLCMSRELQSPFSHHYI